MDDTTRILTNQALIMNALAELLHHMPGGHGELRDQVWRGAFTTNQHLKEVAKAQKRFNRP